jgi:hypothetical protein
MTADTITAIKKALEGVTPDRVERLWWFLHIISKSAGSTDATDDKWNWINAFCHDFEDDTFNRAADLGFISVSFDSIMETSTAKMTPAGNAFIAYFDKAPSASVNAAFESLQCENEGLRAALKPFAKFELSDLKQRALLQILVCPEGDDHADNYGPHFIRARTALSSTGDTHE